jgi:type II secretory pathway pseudopilin PulG
MPNNTAPLKQPSRREQGATLLELIAAVLILTIALLGAAAAISHAFRLNTMSRNATHAKMLGVSLLEQAENLRNTRRLTFGQIANAGAVNSTWAVNPFAGFANAFLPVSANPGPDGIFATNDDLQDAGPDGIFGTGDDFTNNALAEVGYARQITITNLSSSLKRVQVIIRYPGTANNTVELTCVGYLNDNDGSSYTGSPAPPPVP